MAKLKGKIFDKKTGRESQGAVVTAQDLLFRGWGLNLRREAFKKSLNKRG